MGKINGIPGFIYQIAGCLFIYQTIFRNGSGSFREGINRIPGGGEGS